MRLGKYIGVRQKVYGKYVKRHLGKYGKNMENPPKICRHWNGSTLIIVNFSSINQLFWGSRGNSHMEHIWKSDQHPLRYDFSQRNAFC